MALYTARKKERSHGALRILSLFYFVVQVKKVNFKAGDKVGEGDIMVEIEHHPNHWDGNSILGGKGYHNFRLKWLFMSPWKWLTRKSFFEFFLEMPMTKWTDFFVPVKMTPLWSYNCWPTTKVGSSCIHIICTCKWTSVLMGRVRVIIGVRARLISVWTPRWLLCAYTIDLSVHIQITSACVYLRKWLQGAFTRFTSARTCNWPLRARVKNSTCTWPLHARVGNFCKHAQLTYACDFNACT